MDRFTRLQRQQNVLHSVFLVTEGRAGSCVCWWCGFLYEGTSRDYSLFVPQGVVGLIAKSGRAIAFKNRLDTVFTKRFYNVGNEPDFLTPNLYHWLGRPDLSSAYIHQVVMKEFNASRKGIPGSNDSGAMSSWPAFQRIGWYPNNGQSYYLIRSPFVKETTLHLSNGKSFRIIAKKIGEKNGSIQSTTLNGKDYPLSWIERKDIVAGGMLELAMGGKRSDWGTTVMPPSLSKN